MTYGRRLRVLLWIEASLSAIAGILAVITAIVPDWIERVTGSQPDSGGGEVEWLGAVLFALASFAFGYAARRNWRSRRVSTAST